jgi:hypothetical protein
LQLYHQPHRDDQQKEIVTANERVNE